MKKWWNWILILTLVGLLFIAIPLTYPNSRTKEALRPMFNEYVEKFNKSYKDNPAEFETRLDHFVESVKEIDRLNAAARGPEQHRARYGLTQLSDMSKAEFTDIHLSDEKPRKHHHHHSGKAWNKDRDVPNSDEKNYVDELAQNSHRDVYVVIKKKRSTIPLQMDWRSKGVIGPVRDQGLCGACWAFSTIGTMEAMAAIGNGTLNILSVQEVIDCARLGNSGCLGGDICLLLDWLLMTDTAVQVEKEYPLRLTDGVCQVKKNATGVRVKKFTCEDLVGSEEKIIEAIATHGPVAVAVNALTWQNYLGGVIQYHCSGVPDDLNHAVELVGYDLTAEVPYYIAKNSWGKGFGTDGYLRLAVGSNMCGLANEVASIDIK